MFKKATLALITVVAATVVSTGLCLPAFANGATGSSGTTSCATASECVSAGASGASGQSASTSVDAGTIIKNIVNILLYVLGAVAVLMVVIGGIKYVLSNGDANSAKSAKDTILYAVIGVVIAVVAYAIINFVISNIKTTKTP